ncbi:MAG: glycine betaine ABC transporter substrate-binding protein [Chloroflexota bacterium]
MRKAISIMLAVFLSVALMAALTGCVGETTETTPTESEPAEPKKVSVGCKNFAEEYIIGEMMKQVLEANGFEVNYNPDLSSMAMRQGMEAGDLDICAEYTGTGWTTHLKKDFEAGTGNQELYDMMKEADEANGFIWLDPIWNNNTYAMASWPEFANEHNLETLSDLAALYNEKDGKVDTFVDFEFSQRKDGLPGLEDFYGFEIAEGSLNTGQAGMSLTALENKNTDVAMIFGTDPHVPKHGWVVYEDDKSFFPPYDLTPNVRAEVLDQYPEIETILNDLVATFPGGGEEFTSEALAECRTAWQNLNGEVSIEGKDAEEVAHQYLVDNGLIE